MRLSLDNVVGGDQFLRSWQAGGSNADFSERPRTRGNNGPAVLGKTGQQIERARQGDDTFEVSDFTPFHLVVLSFMIGVGKIFADRREAGTSVSASNDFFRIEPVLDGPAPPDARDRGGGVDEDSVHVEQKSSAANLSHITKPTCLQKAWKTLVFRQNRLPDKYLQG